MGMPRKKPTNINNPKAVKNKAHGRARRLRRGYSTSCNDYQEI